MAFNPKRRKHSKPGHTTLRAFHFRLEIGAKEAAKLHQTLSLAWELRNIQSGLLEVSRSEARAAKQRGETPSYLKVADLQQSVTKAALDPKFLALHSQVRQGLCHRVIEGQKRWFEALKAGRFSVKPPRAIARKAFRSITYSQYGVSAHIKGGKLHLAKLGEFRVLGWRKMRGSKKTITLKFKEGHFWAIVLCEVQARDVCRPYASLTELPEAGLDPGLTAVLSDSYGHDARPPKPLKAAAAKLRHIQKDVSRKFEVRKRLHLEVLGQARAAGCKAPVAAGVVDSLRLIPYSNRLKRNIKKLAKAHTKVERVRQDAARKVARKLEHKFKRVAVEEHGLVFMQRNRRLAKASSDVAIGKQKQALRSALGSGRYHEASNRRPEGGNSQTCLCGASTPKTLKERWHTCPECGLQGPRDQISAIICQYETFGTLPQVPESSVPGLGILERAVKALKIRRGESKAGGRESGAGELQAGARAPLAALEFSVKRSTHKMASKRNTTGAGQPASVEVNTGGHANPVRSCPPETKARVHNEHLRACRSGPLSPRSTGLQAGE